MNFKNIFILFFTIILFFIIPVNAGDIIVNGDFETGDFTGWILTGTGVHNRDLVYMAGDYGNYTLRMDSLGEWTYTAVRQNIDDFALYDNVTLDFYKYGNIGHSYYPVVIYSDVGLEYLLTLPSVVGGVPWETYVLDIDATGSGWIEFRGYTPRGYGYDYFDNIFLTEGTPPSFIQFENTPYNEYDNAIVNFSVQKIMEDYPDKRIYLEIATPKITDPYYNYAAYELLDYTGYRGLAIEGKHPTYDAYHNCSAYIRAYDQDMGNYETLLEIEQSVLWDNHTLLNYTGYDYPTNKSYITGQYIGIDVDIIEYIETDFLYWPDEHFLLHVHAFSNSNQGNREYEYHIDPKYWNAQYYHVHYFPCQPFSSIDANFNATIESFITVYRNGNTTQLTPTIYTNMYNSDYIPEGEEGYIPPEIPEEPEEPNIGENETLPINPEELDVPTVTNESINTSWVYYYYEGVNNSFDTLLAPIYNFTGYTLTPIYLLNDSISDYNYIMNESFTETTQKISILSGSFNIIYNSFHPKIISLITYYLIWLVLLIILKKR